MYTSMYYACVSHMYTHLCLCIPRVTFWENSPSREGKMLVETYFCIVQFFMLASFITMCIYYFCNKNKF